jgi:hypothetical protein
MSEEQNNTPQPSSDHMTELRGGALRGSGALEVIAHVTENPTVAATVATTAGVTAKHFLDKMRDPSQKDPPHGGLWVPPSAEE